MVLTGACVVDAATQDMVATSSKATRSAIQGEDIVLLGPQSLHRERSENKPARSQWAKRKDGEGVGG